MNTKELFIPPSEKPETLDKKSLKKNFLKKSKDEVGYLYPIKVAVWFEDPYKDSQTSEKRVHMRPFDGRHRYLQDPNWPKEYYKCGSLDEFYQFRLNSDVKKKPNPNEWKKALKDYGKHLQDVEKVPLEKICSTLCKRLRGVHKMQILRHVPPEWKDSSKIINRLGKTKEKTQTNNQQMHQQGADCVIVTNATKEQEIQALRETIDSNNKEIEVLNEKIRTKNEEIEILKKDNDYLKECIKKNFLNKEIQEGSQSN